MGVGTADADARSTRANLEADTSSMHCESQRRRERIGVCMLNPLRGSACRRIIKGRSAPSFGRQVVMVLEVFCETRTKTSYSSFICDVDKEKKIEI